MSLIKCIECNHEVSGFAESCPNCGCPISMSTNRKKDNNIYSVILVSCGERKVKIIKQIREIVGCDFTEIHLSASLVLKLNVCTKAPKAPNALNVIQLR